MRACDCPTHSRDRAGIPCKLGMGNRLRIYVSRDTKPYEKLVERQDLEMAVRNITQYVAQKDGT